MKKHIPVASLAVVPAALLALTLAASCSRGPRALSDTTMTDGTAYTGGFATATHGYAIGDFGLVLYTDDGGTQWNELSKPIDRNDPSFKPMFTGDNHCAELRFSGDRVTLVLLGSTKKGFALRELVSADGGKTWTPPEDLALRRAPLTVSVDRSLLVSVFNADSTITQVRLSEGF